MRPALRLLIIEDCEDDAELVGRMLRAAGYELFVSRIADPEALDAALGEREWDLIIADHTLPGFGAPEALERVRARGLDVPFIIVSGTLGEERAVAAMRAGANDYVQKDRMARLPIAVQREIEQAGVRRARRELEERQRASERELARIASEDQATGLPNRSVFQAAIGAAVASARDSRSSFAVLHFCLQGFESITTTLGLAVADQVLAATARRLETLIAAPDCMASLGGRHFGVLLRNADSTRARAVSAALALALEEPVPAGEISVQLEPTIGMALYPGHGEQASDLLRCAAVAMDAAKSAGVDALVYSQQQNKLDPEALSILAGLRGAISGQQLFLEFQPIVSLRDERTAGVEALVRWNHPHLGLIAPGRFIPLAESSGLIRPLSHWVLGQGLAHWRAWHRQGVDLRIAVNLSARNLAHPDLLDEVRDLIDTWGVVPGALEIEITESALMTDPARALTVLQKMHDWDISVAIDDFGTGYSSFAYLRSLPVDKLKIDRTFVKALTESKRDASLLRAMIDLGHTLEMTVVAEGVEDEVTYNLLAAFGCDMVQGYFISKPMRNEAMLHFVKTSRFGVRSSAAGLDPVPFESSTCGTVSPSIQESASESRAHGTLLSGEPDSGTPDSVP